MPISRVSAVMVFVFLAFRITTVPAWAVSDEELYQASMREAARVESRYGLVQDPAIVSRIQSVFARVAAASRPTKWPLQVRVLEDSDPNAFSLPNGLVYVNRGLLRLNPTDSELAFALAHEASHVTLEHARKQINRAEVQGTILSILAGGRDVAGLAAQVVNATLQSGYSRQAETESDREALGVVARAGYDPRAALTFFQKLQAATGRTGLRIFPSHPLTANRIKNVERWLAESPYNIGTSPNGRPPVSPGSRPTVP